jgi:hypothetical protein
MSIYETDLDRYCPLRTDINGETRKCVNGCAWWLNGSCSIASLSIHLELLQNSLDESNIAVDDLGETMQDVISEFNSAVRQTTERIQEAVKNTGTKEGES